MKRSSIPRKSSIRRVSRQRAEQRRALAWAVAMDRYFDCQGISYGQARAILEDRFGVLCRNWPAPGKVTNPALFGYMHEHFSFCFVCGSTSQETKIDAHHLARGKSDERCLIAMLCRACHGNVKTPALPDGFLFYRKWVCDPQGTDWIRLAWARGMFLPELIPDASTLTPTERS